MKITFAILLLLCALASRSFTTEVTENSRLQDARHLLEQNFIPNPDSSDRIEFFIKKPEGLGPFPALFLLHGHQRDPSIGGVEFFKQNVESHFVPEGIAVIAISIPGFGNSGGNRDFSGPSSQKLLLL